MSRPAHHVSDDLPALLTGDADREVVLQAAAHLRTCVDCQQELVSAVVAHASLTSAQRFAPEVLQHDEPEAVEAGLPTAPDQLPDLSDLFATVRAEAETAPAPGTARRTPRRRLVAIAAAAAIVVGGGATWAAVQGGDSPASSTRTVALAGDGAAVAKVGDGDTMKLDASSLPALSDGRQYEVWLTKPSGEKQSIGFLTPKRTAELSVPSTLMQRYSGIAVSVQDAGQTEFSGTVVLSGSYT